MEDEQYSNWEDAIDVDDSDLPSLLNPPILPSNNSTNCPSTLPPLKPCSQSQNPKPNPKSNPYPPSQTLTHSSSRPRIPGPAGAIQLAMHRRSHNFFFNSQGEKVDRRTDSILEDEDDEEDEDFKLNPWLFASAFLGRDFELRSPIGSIKNRKNVADRIPQVVGVVKSCVPNGLGDLFITLKDPTGTIGASIHRNVLMECDLGGDISVGCAIILKQVSVFCPGRSACYLNVTVTNMVKLIGKDCGLPPKQMMPSSEARYSTLVGKQMKDGSDSWEKLPSPNQREECVTNNEVRREVNNGRVMNLMHNVTARDVNVSVNPDIVKKMSSTFTAKLDHGLISTENTVDERDPKANAIANMVVKHGPRVNTSKNVVAKPHLRTYSKIDATTKVAAVPEEPKKAISRVSAARWTDEQLLELFVDYEDDMQN